MKVKITGSDSSCYWYAAHIGEIFEVKDLGSHHGYEVSGCLATKWIDRANCEIVQENAVSVEEYTGSTVSYYTASITHPTNPDKQPYEAECNDIIEALGMNFAEGNAFKAIWRSCAARNLGKNKKGYDEGLYDAEKVVFFGTRMVEMAKQK